MAAKTPFTPDDFVAIVSQYNLGTYTHSEAIHHGTVQTNYFVQTTEGKFVFRYYETRSQESVLFESDLLAYLAAHNYPSPRLIADVEGIYVGSYRAKPYVLAAFIEGEIVEHPNMHQWRQLVQKVAELHRLTQHFTSAYTSYRWNYGPDLCRQLAEEAAERIDTHDAYAKNRWLVNELAALELPAPLPKGVCHCDFHESNVLFDGQELAAVLDFDDANWTFLLFDLVGLIESRAWTYPRETIDLVIARNVVQEYIQYRPLSLIEQQHLYDVYKLSILFDCVWYFGRGSADDFYEKRKIDALGRLGRQTFFGELFKGEDQQ